MICFPRFLFYAVNGLGLGHVTRLLAIARKVRDLVPDAEIVFLTSSEAEDVIFREGFAAFKVPSKTIRPEARLRSSTYARMLQTVTLNLLASFHPHVLVVDTFPAGPIQELCRSCDGNRGRCSSIACSGRRLPIRRSCKTRSSSTTWP